MVVVRVPWMWIPKCGEASYYGRWFFLSWGYWIVMVG